MGNSLDKALKTVMGGRVEKNLLINNQNLLIDVMKTKNIAMYYSIGGAVYAGVLLLMGPSAPAQTLFAGSYGSENITEIPTSGSQSVFASGLDYPTGLAFNGSGDLFEADQSSGKIYEYTPGYINGETPITFASGLNQPSEMAFNSSGDLFVNSAASTIYEFTPTGTKTTFISGLDGSSGLAFNSAGDLFVGINNGGNSGSAYISEITPQGVQTTYATGLYWPEELAFDGAGDLFVASGLGGTITKITPEGVQTTFASGLNLPYGLAINSAGDVFVADGGANQENGDITEFAPNGTEITTITSVSKPTALAFQGETLPVPEPSSIALLTAGTAILFLRRRKK
jgi:glucose/arabinose dehydrogenase